LHRTTARGRLLVRLQIFVASLYSGCEGRTTVPVSFPASSAIILSPPPIDLHLLDSRIAVRVKTADRL
jgi:hypothetical protein